MPRLGDEQNLENFQLGLSHYGFSATRIDDLDASEYTLVGIAFDSSSSTHMFRDEMKKTQDKIIESCQKSPRKDNLLLRATTFSDSLDEIHGFRQLATIQPGEYDSKLDGGGGTALYDAVLNNVEAIGAYAKQLSDHDFSVNGILFIITDGMDNRSSHGISGIVDATKRVIQEEALESLVTIMVGVNLAPESVQYLNDLKDKAGLTQFINIGDATPGKLAKLAEFVSKSISATSQSLGSGGGASQQIAQSATISF